MPLVQDEWMPPNGVWDRTLVAFEFTDNDGELCACFWELDLDDYDPYCDPMYEAPVGSWYIVDMLAQPLPPKRPFSMSRTSQLTMR